MTRLAVGGALALLVVACRDVPQAPTLPTPPAPGPFAVLRVDRVGPPIMEPASFSDAAGSLHLLYGAWAVGAVRYAGCATNCDLSRSWHIGEVDSSFLGIGDGGQVAAGLTTTGIHLLYQSAVANGQNAFLSYGWCPGACYLKTSWLTAVVDTMADVPATYENGGASAVVDPAGGIRAFYLAPAGVRYAECSTSCANSGNWQRATLASASSSATAIALGADGRVHGLFFRRDSLWYATCAAACGNAANWQLASILTAPPSCCYLDGLASLVVGSDNRLHALASVASFPRLHALTYLTCTASCTSAAAWQSVTLDSLGKGVLALGPDGALHMAFGRTNGALTYARCDSSCLSAGAWKRMTVDSPTSVNGVALTLGATGKPTIAFATYSDVYVALMR